MPHIPRSLDQCPYHEYKIHANCKWNNCAATYQFGHLAQNVLLGVFQIVRALDGVDVGDVGDIGDAFGAIVNAFDLCDIGDIIDDDCLVRRFDNLLHKVRVRALVYDFPCVRAGIVYLIDGGKQQQ